VTGEIKEKVSRSGRCAGLERKKGFTEPHAIPLKKEKGRRGGGGRKGKSLFIQLY